MPLFNVVIIIINEHESNYLLSRCEVTFNSRVKLLLQIVTRQLSYSQSSPGINQQSSHIIAFTAKNPSISITYTREIF